MSETAARVLGYIQSSELADEQRAICMFDGQNAVVRACPGSGKTRTVGARFAYRMASWEDRRGGIAAISFTNVAWAEIGRQLFDLGLPSRPAWPHFLGTIDSFVNQFIFLPFGHAVMGCRRRPEIVHEGNAAWVAGLATQGLGQCRRKGCSPTSFAYQADGSLKYRGLYGRQPRCRRDRCQKVKDAMTKRGFALHEDAMYFGMRVLEEASISAAIARRFPEIIVDEAQDSSEAQVCIVRALADAGSNIIVVGDPDQAIYEYHGARPDLFLSFAEAWPSLPLSANWRSSQLICNATSRFSSLTEPTVARGPCRDDAVNPTIVLYSGGDPVPALGVFTGLLAEHGIQAGDAAVLCRTRKMVSHMSGRDDREKPRGVSHLTMAFARAAAYRDTGQDGEAHEATMWAMLRMCFGRATYGPNGEAIQDIGERNWRRLTWRLVSRLPSSGASLAGWGRDLRDVLSAFLEDTGWPCDVKLSSTFQRCNAPDSSAPMAEFVSGPEAATAIPCTTVHKAKGMTYEAVLVVCGPGTRSRPCDLHQWLEGPAGDREERRVGYVAMTRPRRLLVLAVPEEADLGDMQDDFDVLHGAAEPA